MIWGKRIVFGFAFFVFAVSFSKVVYSANSFNSLSFKPATDQGQYLTIEQSQTLGQLGYAAGLMAEFSNDSVVLYGTDGARRHAVIGNQVATHIGGALGLVDWLNAGLLVGLVPYHQFYSPADGSEDSGFKMSDIRFNFKGRLLNVDKYPVGLAIVPFVTFPTGSDSHFVGDGNVTGGGVLVIESPRLFDRLSIALNVGGDVRRSATLSVTETEIGSRFLAGLGMNIGLLDSLQLIGEVTGWTPFANFWSENVRNLEGNGALRWFPMKGLSLTFGGGTGILDGIGAPDYRAFGAVAYRHPKEEKPPAPVPVKREEVIRVNTIHFQFDKSVVLRESYPVIDQIVALIKGRTDIEHIVVEGHTDSKGSDAYNLALSDRRANSVMGELVKRGVPAEMLSAEGKGEGVPIASNETKEGRALNRRVEFHLQLKPDAAVNVVEDETKSPTFLEQ